MSRPTTQPDPVDLMPPCEKTTTPAPEKADKGTMTAPDITTDVDSEPSRGLIPSSQASATSPPSALLYNQSFEPEKDGVDAATGKECTMFDANLERLRHDYKLNKYLCERLAVQNEELSTEMKSLQVRLAGSFSLEDVQDMLLMTSLERAKQQGKESDPVKFALSSWERWKSNFNITCDNIKRRRGPSDKVNKNIETYNTLIGCTGSDSVKRVHSVYFDSTQ